MCAIPPEDAVEAMIQQYKNGETKHLFVLKGLVQLVEGQIQLRFRGGDHSAVVFEAFRSTGDRWTIKYRHPLSLSSIQCCDRCPAQPNYCNVDMLPPLDSDASAPPMLTTELAHVETLSHAYSVVYCMCVGNRVFCGTTFWPSATMAVSDKVQNRLLSSGERTLALYML